MSAQDKEMLDNDLVWLLGEPADPQADWSWVKPGKVAWEWWNNWHVTGVDFKDGINVQRHAEDYRRTLGQAEDTMTVEMAPGGGFAAIFSKL